MVAISIEQHVHQRADGRCEYCRLPQRAVEKTFPIDHIFARQHILDDSLNNLAYSCYRCNTFKGPNLASVDPINRAIVALFHPRTQSWQDHFVLRGALIHGLTPPGRVTVRLLKFNELTPVVLRSILIRKGLF